MSLIEIFRFGELLWFFFVEFFGWLLVEDADTAREGGPAKNHGILPLRTIVGEPLHMEDIKSSWFPGGKKGSNTNKQLLSDGLLVGGVKVFKADMAQCCGCKAKYVAFGSKPDVLVKKALWFWNPPKSTFFGWFQNGTTDHAAPKRGPSRVGFRF